ncbi:phosphomannose isomerase type II C-terminal cupin domain [Nodularia spumigena CS-584]|jgi:mannose-6-phosphate isomerase|uniref:Mannose-6-phosphate isomerase n=1 Tax=Nodularia spumigena UHCC 0039 TaxID=1914872 RepID=A0A2S0Q9H3_NODSP|nr:phosphomannose isomerase type II C-terminal cupin domain [Nodularia spumigena]AHJ26563.1 Mannose-6-phosphate isomerase [Nodularia spumigena CCY9414]AVZ30960.1 mannose-6-phosphate isomerase [Nodularia spumigena UHCC 0039]EAW46175.1 mannose-6-phosphate isomerase [Nodularia spumigena CCY9414]MDB9384308.1 phosphomannose isomerase type II C-terminal cupin domain [Nodularia spumigena CS-584]
MSHNENDIQSNINETSSHSGARYWGNVEVIEEGESYRISRVEINPRHGIKPQIHYHRNEHWVVVSGVAKVTCGEEEKLLNRNESTFVPAATLHKVDNPGQIPLVILEIQNGEYLGEDDTERPYELNLIKPGTETKKVHEK